MNRESLRSFLAAAFALLSLLGLSACAVPLAPGYRILKEKREIRFVPGEAPELQVSAQFTLKNSGTTDLEFIDIDLPDQEMYGRQDLRVELDGNPAKLENLPDEYQATAPGTLRMPFETAWKRGQQHELTVEYNFRSPRDIGDRITIGAEDFHLGPRGWSPLPRPPRHFLSPFPTRPDRTTYTVAVPADFLVLGGGRLKSRKHSSGRAEYTFELRQSDLTPSIVAGRYAAFSPEAKTGGVIFWTLQPLKENPQAASESIMAVWNALGDDFGPLEKNIRVPHIVESGTLREHLDGEQAPGAAAFPGGVLVNAQLLSMGLTSEAFQDRVTHALAHDWFGNEVFFGRFTALGLGEGLPEYATIVADEAQNGPAGRRRRVAEFLRRYDDARTKAEEIPLGVSTLSDPLPQQQISLAKAPLFFIALEDACGEKPMRDGLKQLIALLRGQEVSYDTLRSELDLTSGKHLADLFRVWLNNKGIPEDFRARYEGADSSAQIVPADAPNTPGESTFSVHREDM